ncbi:DUF2920 family protein [Campylobacter sp. LR196d]|nr:DUF2920 family protein [Campylobacter sp. LR196d]
MDYHCIANIEPLGATLDYDYIDKFILKTACKSIDFPISDDDIKDTQSIKNTIARINCHIIKMKKEAKILNKFILKLSTSLIPARNEYNNFGIMGLGKEIDYTRFSSMILIHYTRETNEYHIITSFHDKTLWTMNSKHPYFFSPSRRQIRNILNEEHLKTQSAYPKSKYISYHSIFDKDISPYHEKIKLYKCLKNLGFEARLFVAKDKKDIDGKFIKNLRHGMAMSLKTLIQKELPPLLEEFKNYTPPKLKKQITYETDEYFYNFSEVRNKIKLTCQKKS